MNFLDWLKESWLILAAAIAGITLVWNFRKTFSDIKETITKPLTDVNKKIDDLSNEFNDKLGRLEQKIDAAEKSDKQVRGALLTMQRNSLLRSCEDFMKRGFATVNEKETITSQYDSYHELGGDSFITDLIRSVMDLPLEKQTKATSKKSKE